MSIIRQKRPASFLPLAQMTAAVVNPVLQKKAGLNMRLVQNWPEIVGRDIAGAAMPLKIIWPRQQRDAPRPENAGGSGRAAARGADAAERSETGRKIDLKQPPGAAVLVIGCFGYAALKIQHETGEILARINRFFGYPAIAKIKIEQKMPMGREPRQGAGIMPMSEARQGAGILPMSKARQGIGIMPQAGGAAAQWVKTPFGFAAAPQGQKAMTEAVRADIAEIDDEALRAAVQRLGRAVYKH